ncbi:MAG: diguanylate cyclase [Gammaproteobacteria bacterium]|nr:diguanylate cyclase [Gammaproteobacteria bacterium]
MKHLLIIDDSIAILKSIEFIVNSSGKYKPYLASSYSEAKSLIDKCSFFAAIVDLNLPDCNEGEAVKLTCSHDIPSIVLTGTINDSLRNKIKQFPIVDYIFKSDEESIFSAVFSAESLLNFEKEKLLLVDPNKESALNLKSYFQRLTFDVTLANCAESALTLLKMDNQFKVIITEQHLPDDDGVHLIQSIKKLKFQRSPVIFAIIDSDDSDSKTLLLKSGAQDVLNKPINSEEIYLKLANILHMREQESRIDRYMTMINNHVITSETDLHGNITYVSSAFCNISGYTKEELIGKNHNLVRHPDMSSEVYEDLWETIQSGSMWQGEIKNKCKDGSYYWGSVYIEPVLDKGGDCIGYRAILEDITDKKHIEQESLTDSMTDLYNRRYYNQVFPRLLSMGKREGRPVAMILLDVDHFKLYNDNYGHQKGDDVLTAIGTTLKETCQRGNDTPFRMGGEEFGVLSFNSDTRQIEAFAKKLCKAIESLSIPHEYNSASDFVTASFGVISTSSNQALDMDQLYSEADKALYQAKESGRNQVCYSE